MRPTLVLLLCFLLSAPSALPADVAALRGFSSTAERAQREWETKYRASLDRGNIRRYMQRMTARPHHVGSAFDKDNAEWILERFKEWGLDAKMETYEVLFPSPKERALELLEPGRFTAKLREPAVAGDPTSSQFNEQLPTYNAYSIDGDVTAPLVYANYGAPEDYDRLAELGVSVKGAIVITRYGGTFRGIKPKVAAEHGAVGCLIYSDPRDDGFYQGEVFPKGPFRPSDGVQRGSVLDIPLMPGDPLTPGIGATKDAKRIKMSEATTLTKIPTLPISYGDAQPLLAALTGPVAPERWRGALPITYRVGPGAAKVHLKVTSQWDMKTIYNVIARIPGAVDPDEWIIRGNHHDGWVNGAADPASGASALMEEARALGILLRQGWRPRRTIVYCVWDGEEEGLLGSTEWAEEHAQELRGKAAVYINSDGNGRGFLNVAGSHTLEKFINSVARDVQDPETGLTVWKRLQLRRLADVPTESGATRAVTPADRQELRQREDLRISALGSGSDYSVFLDHLGVASVNLAFGGEDRGGVYHSIYDDFTWYTNFADTDFSYGKALAEVAGLAVLRLAGAEVLPYDFMDFADTIKRYAGEIEKLAQNQRSEITERNLQIQEGVFAANADPRQKTVPPVAEEVPPVLDLKAMQDGLAALQRTSELYEKAYERAFGAGGGAALARASLRTLNADLISVERSLTHRDGLPGRPWFQHMIYAPGFYTGYDSKTLPGVRESIEQKQWKQAQAEIARVGRVLENAGERIQSAAGELNRAVQ